MYVENKYEFIFSILYEICKYKFGLKCRLGAKPINLIKLYQDRNYFVGSDNLLSAGSFAMNIGQKSVEFSSWHSATRILYYMYIKNKNTET